MLRVAARTHATQRGPPLIKRGFSVFHQIHRRQRTEEEEEEEEEEEDEEEGHRTDDDALDFLTVIVCVQVTK